MQTELDWRLIIEKDVSPAYGLAVDQTSCLSVARRGSPPILHLYNFLPSVIVGRYQDISSAVDVAACKQHELVVGRRHTGGGTVLMGPAQLAIGFAIPISHPCVQPNINSVFSTCGNIICKVLKNLGIEARYRPKNDIEVDGRKVAGLSASLEERTVAFFHCSLLLDFDIKLMVEVLKVPPEKMKDKLISCFSKRLITIKRKLGRKAPNLPALQSVTRAAFEEAFGVRFRIDILNEWERNKLDELIQTRYTNPQWIFSDRHPTTASGTAIKKTAGGLVEVSIMLAGGVLESVTITGDFFSEPAEINRIEAALKYKAATRKKLLPILKKVMHKESIFKVSPNQLADLIIAAKKDAQERMKPPHRKR